MTERLSGGEMDDSGNWLLGWRCRQAEEWFTMGELQVRKLRELFDGVDDLTVGAEEELLLLDPSSLGLRQ